MKEEPGLRIPRPMGTTEMGYQRSKHPTEENKQKLEEHLIRHYITNNFMYCNKHYNIEEVSILLNIPQAKVLGHTINYGTNLQSMMDKLTNNDALRALQSLAIKSSLEDRGRAVEQYSILKSSQGNGYKAFISSEVNKALKLVMDSGQNMALLVKNMGSGSPTNILIQNAQPGALQGPQHGQDYVTIDKAIMLIKDSGIVPLGLDTLKQERLYLENGIEDTPEVNALMQEGVDTSKEALNLGTITDFRDEDYGHEDRRAYEEDVDLDADEL